MLISIRLRIHGDLLDVAQVTTMLAVSPHFARTKGEVDPTKSGKNVIAKTGRWEWYSEDPTRRLSIDDHISRLEAQFGRVAGEFVRIPNVMKAWVDVCIVTVNPTGDSQINFLMSHKSIAVLNKIGLPVEFSIYTLAEEVD